MLYIDKVHRLFNNIKNKLGLTAAVKMLQNEANTNPAAFANNLELSAIYSKGELDFDFHNAYRSVYDSTFKEED